MGSKHVIKKPVGLEDMSVYVHVKQFGDVTHGDLDENGNLVYETRKAFHWELIDLATLKEMLSKVK